MHLAQNQKLRLKKGVKNLLIYFPKTENFPKYGKNTVAQILLNHC